MKSFPVAAAPHVPAARSVRIVMLWVIAALLPGIAGHVWWFGAGLLLQIALATGFALLFEAAMLVLRRQPLRPFLTDLSAPLTAILFALCLPPLAPWWIAAIGMAAAIVLAKQLYGGLGYNLFNPAMVGFVVVLLCFPYELSQWTALDRVPDVAASWQAILTGVPSSGWDTLAQPTPLDLSRQLASSGLSLTELRAEAGLTGAAGSAFATLAWLYGIGGLVLLWRRIIPWQVPAALIGTVVLLTLPLHLYEPYLHPSPVQHLTTGALVLAAFFIATDPVSGCTTPRGRLVFGAGVAALTLAIRRWGSYPDGVAFAVLLMNCAAPWLDLQLRPRIFGEARR